MSTMLADSYLGIADLVRHQVPGIDFEIIVQPRTGSSVAVIAPHGGAIERGTSEIARAIAGEDFNLYLFEGIKRSRNYASLHLTSCHFDEPLCVDLIARCSFVVAIHGCRGSEEEVLLGGLYYALKAEIADALEHIGVTVHVDGHRYPAISPHNICNRGRTAKGVQLEISAALRRNAAPRGVANVVRQVLLRLDAA